MDQHRSGSREIPTRKRVYLALGGNEKITVSYENDTVSIDDDSIQQFIKRTKLGITSEYIDELEQLCMEKTKPADCMLHS